MASIKIGAGTTFNVTIPLPADVTTYENVLVALYTSGASPIKFSYVTKTGYNKLNVGNTNFQLLGLLTSAQTANMRGDLIMEMRFVDAVGSAEDSGTSVPTFVTDNLGNNVEIVPNVLKNAL